MTTSQTVPIGTETPKLVVSLKEMMERVATEPKSRFIYSGIKEGSVGIVFGPSKSGKTMYCENLGMAIASGQTEFLSLPIDIDNKKVLMVSFEEYYTNRTERNAKQAAKLAAKYGNEWAGTNYDVITEHMPTYIGTTEEWKKLADIIIESGAGTVILDSITRMSEGIEEGPKAQEFTRRLKGLARYTKTTIIAIHHTTKLHGAPITMDSIAGSRIMSQEFEFAIGINRAPDGKRYIKEVFFRYAPSDDEKVQCFKIDDHCWLNATSKTTEMRLLQVLDGRRKEDNGEKIKEYLLSVTPKGGAISSELEAQLVPEVMSRGTLFNQLKKLKDEQVITEVDGKYKIAA